MAVAAGKVLKSRYEIERHVASGGMGSVYVAHDRVLDVRVALKELFDRSPEARDQFEKEARILARLSHPGLPRVTDAFTEGRTAWLAMDFVDGEDLQVVVARDGAFGVARVVDMGLQICSVLSYIHGQGIVHRDLKPANLRLRPDGRVVLVDFGIARPGGGQATSAFAHGACTPMVAPPEQCTASGSSAPSTDIYALGVTLYFLVTGGYPPDSVSRLMGAVVPSCGVLDAVVQKAMALDAADRFANAGDMARALSLISTPAPVAPPNLPVPVAAPSTVFRREIRRW